MPRYTQPKKTWFYPVNFKIKAVELSLRNDILSKDVAQALDIHPFMLYRWWMEHRKGTLFNQPLIKNDATSEEKTCKSTT